ncbi:hypothetical protein BBO_09448 [Beauveria brongniartii RCEF 3172]|uniref:Uncharacterized protein n=1 Tax=Beauveria brongniartii RCEF 3172 TaxID=1081107 RepID=A0A166RTI6_9HYPO|nr:hypothetical protein BBO_09448 [Beauveria brongniartii RCEF 3172]
MVEKAITQQVKEVCGRDNACSGSEKMLGKGYGGWTGISKTGIVLKRDAGNRRVGNHREQYGTDPGGVWQPGDLEVWIAWYGWSCLCCRYSRWKPGYHLVLHLANLAAAIDYAVTREVFRDWKADWMRASEWLWLNMPVDITGDCANILSGELMEIVHSEEERIYNLNPEVYVPHDANTTAKRYKLLQDRFAGCIAHHAVGEGLQTPRGLAAGWAMCVLNDIGDYERDLLCGERNNLVRSLTSDQQVIDAAAWILKILHWSFKSHDYDLADAILGTNTFNFFLWRYNLQKMAMYEAIGIRNSRPAEPLELQDIAEIVQSNIPGAAGNGGEPYFYGELYDNIKEDVERLYWGCTCSNPCEGHDAWKLFAQAMDEAGNDDIEERLLISLVQLDSGANDGDLSCECALDLLLYEGFVRFFDPETGIVARMHYRSGNMELGNTITE